MQLEFIEKFYQKFLDQDQTTSSYKSLYYNRKALPPHAKCESSAS